MTTTTTSHGIPTLVDDANRRQRQRQLTTTPTTTTPSSLLFTTTPVHLTDNRRTTALPPPIPAATVGLAILLITNVITWKDCLNENGAWDTLTWFAALIAMAAYLNKFGFIPWFSDTVVKVVSGLGLGWQPAFGIIVGLYFYSHYFFASGASCAAE